MRPLVLALLLAGWRGCPDRKFCRSCDFAAPSAHCLLCDELLADPTSPACLSPPLAVDNCAAYFFEYGRVVCELCRPGFRLSEAKACERCLVQNCAVCDRSRNECDGCAAGVAGSPKSCKSDSSCLDNCEVCSTGEERRCLVCAAGFAMENQACSAGPENCLTKAGRACLLCRAGFYVTKERTCSRSSWSLWWVWLVLAAGLAAFLVVKLKRLSQVARAHNNDEFARLQ